MKENIKIICLITIAISLSIIAYNSSKEVSYLQMIEEKLFTIGERISNLR
ncbi:hypothetical protein [Neobacillus sp. PS2-9]|nr:hypothetical protein [Neobacillus sp. PS2-9]WML56477.1 hypothetical protein RCG25_16240 [Neobacillus sp. PS2-9]